MTFSIDPAALAELNDAIHYYESQRKGLGLEFQAEVLRLIADIGANPTRWPTLSRRTRRHRSLRFPYAVVYRATGDSHVHVVALMHGARKPGYWTDRSI
jgi:toxin ParE1/3/4